MAGLRDRPLTRNALLAGTVIAIGAVVALVGLDSSPVSDRKFASVASAPFPSDDSSSRFASPDKAAHSSHASVDKVTPRQNGFGTLASKKKSDDMTVVMMVPDLPPANPAPAPPSGVWSDQGSAAPVNAVNAQGSGAPLAMSAVGGVSSPLTSPIGNSQPGSTASSGASLNSPNVGGNGGGHSPASSPAIDSHSGFVLIAGGQGDGQFALSSAELFDPAKNAFAAAPSMKDARTSHTATTLQGGRILIAGGEGPSGAALSSAELYDPVAGTFVVVGSKMNAARADHSATLIQGCNCPADGMVLIAGGVASGSQGATLRSAELFDPVNGKFTLTGSMKSTRARHSASLIASGPLAGNVLIAGGISDENGGDVASAELYDPATGTFTPAGSMSTPRESHSATWLSPAVVSGTLAGNVLIAGGSNASTPSDTAEVFNPQTASFSPVGAMTKARTLQSAVLLDTGKVLIAGGQSGDTEFLVTAELFDPAHASFSATGSMNNLHVGATATVLQSGGALIAGGRSSFADVYNPTTGTFSSTGRMVTDLAESTSTLIR